MDRRVLKLDKQRCYLLTEEFFERRLALLSGSGRSEKKKQRAFQAAADLSRRIRPKATWAYYGKGEMELSGAGLRLQEKWIQCKAFERIKKDTVIGVYVYAVTIGDMELSEKEKDASEKTALAEKLYKDMWGTACTDAARTVLREELGKRSAISESFGPGFYGMGMEEMKTIDALLGFTCIGAKLRSNMIIPEKSSAGLCFAVTEKYEPMGRQCLECIGNPRGCDFCEIRGTREKKERS